MFRWLKSKKGKELVEAARWGRGNRLKTLKNLVESKADVNHPNEEGRAALFWCCDSEIDIPCLKYLIEQKADVNHMDNSNFTSALNRAVLSRNVEAVKVLLENKANPNQKNKLDRTPLFTAAEYADETIVNLLLEYKASPVEKAQGGGIPYDYAKRSLENELNYRDATGATIKRRQGAFFALSLQGLSYSKALKKYKEDLQDYEKAASIITHDSSILSNFPTALIHVVLLPYLKPVEPKDPRVPEEKVETNFKLR